jgi:fructokinase
LLWDVYPDGRKVAGGAPFNFAFHCHQLGHTAAIVSRVGDDELGRELRERVQELGLSDEYIQKDHDYPTGTVRVTLDANGVPTYTITENVAWDYIEWDSALVALKQRSRVMCFGTLALRDPVSRATIFRLVDDVANSIKILDLNLRPPHESGEALTDAIKHSQWLKLSRAEYTRLPQLVGWDEVEDDFATYLECILGINLICITDGPDGCELISERGDFKLPGVPAHVVDTVGAGDAFTAAMVCLHLEGRSLRECARFANHYAARVCEHHGATPRIDRRDVELAAGLCR